MKIVCDFDTIRTQLGLIKDQLTEMDTAISKYESDIATTLTSWKGSAKEAFTLTNEEQVTTTKTHVSDLTAIVEFVEKAVEEIEKIENEVANLKI